MNLRFTPFIIQKYASLLKILHFNFFCFYKIAMIIWRLSIALLDERKYQLIALTVVS
jgi:hypothetical protein